MAKKKSLPPLTDKAAIKKLVDQFGFACAALAPEIKKLEAMKAQLKAQGIGKYEGELWDVTVFDQANNSTDMDAVRAKLKELMKAPGQYTRFMKNVVTEGTKRVVKPTAKSQDKAVKTVDLPAEAQPQA